MSEDQGEGEGEKEGGREWERGARAAIYQYAVGGEKIDVSIRTCPGSAGRRRRDV